MTTNDDAGPSPLILTVFGLYARPAGGWLPVAGIVALMGEVGVDGPAVRSAVSRLKRREVIAPARQGGVAGYGLTAPGLALLEDGDRRIFSTRPGRLEDGWCLATFSVPESQRDRRHRIRTALGRLGFGAVAPGVAVAPSHLLPLVREELAREGLEEHVDLFRADLAVDTLADLSAKVATWWDLERIDAAYREFLVRHESLLDGATAVDPRQAFARYLPMLTAWRRLPYLDPGLPAEVLPDTWSAGPAREVFQRLSAQLRDGAYVHAASALPGLPARRDASSTD